MMRLSQAAALMVARCFWLVSMLSMKAGVLAAEASGLEVDASVRVDAYRRVDEPAPTLIVYVDEIPDYPDSLLAAYLAKPSILDYPPAVAAYLASQSILEDAPEPHQADGKLPDLDAPGGPEWSPPKA